MTFVFYDIETTGLETQFDQILQFAAIRTDHDLALVDARQDEIDLRCRRLPHVVPSPGALRVNRIDLGLLESEKLSHYQMMRGLAVRLQAWSPAVFLGYNSIGFDEFILRQALYQTLHPIDLTEAADSCRADVMVMVQAAAVYAPDSIVIPREDGRLRFNLRAIARANDIDLSEDAAHDALNDVRATLQVARLLKRKVPMIWDRMIGNTKKSAIKHFVTQNEFFNLTTFRRSSASSDVVTAVGGDSDADRDFAALNLAYNPADFLCLNEQQLTEALHQWPMLVRVIRADAQPIIMPFGLMPYELRDRRLFEDIYRARAKAVRGDPKFAERLSRVLKQRQSQSKLSSYVEQMVLDARISAEDARLCEQFHQLPWRERGAICEQLQDRRLRELGRRLIYVECPEVLGPDERLRMDEWLRHRIGAMVPWRTIQAAIQEIEDARRGATPEVTARLQAIADYLKELPPQREEGHGPFD